MYALSALLSLSSASIFSMREDQPQKQLRISPSSPTASSDTSSPDHYIRSFLEELYKHPEEHLKKYAIVHSPFELKLTSDGIITLESTITFLIHRLREGGICWIPITQKKLYYDLKNKKDGTTPELALKIIKESPELATFIVDSVKADIRQNDRKNDEAARLYLATFQRIRKTTRPSKGDSLKDNKKKRRHD